MQISARSGIRDAGVSGEDAVWGEVLDGAGRGAGRGGGRRLVPAAGAVRTGRRGIDDEGVCGLDRAVPAMVLAGPGTAPARGARRVNAVLAAVRGMVVHAVAAGQAPGHLVPLLYEVADNRDLPDAVRGEDAGTGWRLRARHRLHEPQRPVDRAADADIVAVLGACRSARDRLIVLLMARAGLRRGEVLGLRRGDVHLLADSRALGCEVERAHLHVVRREDNPNGAVAKSRRQRAVPLEGLIG